MLAITLARLATVVTLLMGALAPLVAIGANDQIVFGVNEGVTYRITAQETRERYREMAELMAATLKRPVRVEPVDDYVRLRRNLEEKRYDVAFVHPAHHSLRAIRDQGYRLVCLTRGFTEYKARFLVQSGSPLSKPQEVGAQRMVMPDPDSITAWMVRATLRDLGIDVKTAKLDTTRYQDGIPFYLQNGFSDVGITAAGAVVKQWQAAGGRVLFESRAVPIKHMIASPSLSRADVERLRAMFVGLSASPKDRRIIEKLGFQGFVEGNEKTLAEITVWLGI